MSDSIRKTYLASINIKSPSQSRIKFLKGAFGGKLVTISKTTFLFNAWEGIPEKVVLKFRDRNQLGRDEDIEVIKISDIPQSRRKKIISGLSAT